MFLTNFIFMVLLKAAKGTPEEFLFRFIDAFALPIHFYFLAYALLSGWIHQYLRKLKQKKTRENLKKRKTLKTKTNHNNNFGVLNNTLSYDAFGIPSSNNIERFGYTGQIWLKDLGVYYYKARIYGPKLGRLLQTDSIGYEDKMNLYAYVGNDSVNYTDPTKNLVR